MTIRMYGVGSFDLPCSARPTDYNLQHQKSINFSRLHHQTRQTVDLQWDLAVEPLKSTGDARTDRQEEL